MTPERWQEIDRPLEQELDRWGAFLHAACQGDARLRQEVESLLIAGLSRTRC